MVVVKGVAECKSRIPLGLTHCEQVVSGALPTKAQEIKDYLQANAPWTDRTGEARALLACEPYSVGDVSTVSSNATGLVAGTGIQQGYNVILHGDSDHNLWLEVCNGARFAVITPALYRFAPEIVALIRAQLAADASGGVGAVLQTLGPLAAAG